MNPASVRVLGDRNTAFESHRELDAALALMPDTVHAEWMPSDDPRAADLQDVDGLWVAPGSPYRCDAAVYGALRSARETRVPTLATCGGFQYALVELARNGLGVASAGHAELEPHAQDLVVVPLACSLRGERRLVMPVAGTQFAAIVGTEPFAGAHFCSYGANPAFVDRLKESGLREAAHAPDAGLEAFELAGHPFFMATLFQPQVGASSGRMHPLLAAFAEAAGARSRARAARSPHDRQPAA